jgi:hypothetical protein
VGERAVIDRGLHVRPSLKIQIRIRIHVQCVLPDQTRSEVDWFIKLMLFRLLVDPTRTMYRYVKVQRYDIPVPPEFPVRRSIQDCLEWKAISSDRTTKQAPVMDEDGNVIQDMFGMVCGVGVRRMAAALQTDSVDHFMWRSVYVFPTGREGTIDVSPDQKMMWDDHLEEWAVVQRKVSKQWRLDDIYMRIRGSGLNVEGLDQVVRQIFLERVRAALKSKASPVKVHLSEDAKEDLGIPPGHQVKMFPHYNRDERQKRLREEDLQLTFLEADRDIKVRQMELAGVSGVVPGKYIRRNAFSPRVELD